MPVVIVFPVRSMQGLPDEASKAARMAQGAGAARTALGRQDAQPGEARQRKRLLVEIFVKAGWSPPTVQNLWSCLPLTVLCHFPSLSDVRRVRWGTE